MNAWWVRVASEPRAHSLPTTCTAASPWPTRRPSVHARGRVPGSTQESGEPPSWHRYCRGTLEHGCASPPPNRRHADVIKKTPRHGRLSHDDDCTRESSRAGHGGHPGRRARRRPHRRRRGLRDRRRAPPAGAVPGPDVRRPRGAGRPRRHLVDQPVPGCPLRQRPVHLRLPVQAVARPVDRGRGGDPQLPRRGHRGERPRAAHPLPPPGHRGRLVHGGAPVDRGGHPGRHRGAAALHHRLPVDVPGLLQPRQALPAAAGRAWTGSRA